MDYWNLYQAYLGDAFDIFYVEDVWVDEFSKVPPPAGQMPDGDSHLASRILPILGNAHVHFGEGLASEAQCGEAGLLAKPGEPLVTDFFLLIFLETGSVGKALKAAKRLRVPRDRWRAVEPGETVRRALDLGYEAVLPHYVFSTRRGNPWKIKKHVEAAATPFLITATYDVDKGYIYAVATPGTSDEEMLRWADGLSVGARLVDKFHKPTRLSFG